MLTMLPQPLERRPGGWAPMADSGPGPKSPGSFTALARRLGGVYQASGVRGREIFIGYGEHPGARRLVHQDWRPQVLAACRPPYSYPAAIRTSPKLAGDCPGLMPPVVPTAANDGATAQFSHFHRAAGALDTGRVTAPTDRISFRRCGSRSFRPGRDTSSPVPTRPRRS